jgi:hypothetical protein
LLTLLKQLGCLRYCFGVEARISCALDLKRKGDHRGMIIFDDQD